MSYEDGQMYIIAGLDYKYRSGRFYRGNYYLEESLVEGTVKEKPTDGNQ